MLAGAQAGPSQGDLGSSCIFNGEMCILSPTFPGTLSSNCSPYICVDTLQNTYRETGFLTGHLSVGLASHSQTVNGRITNDKFSLQEYILRQSCWLPQMVNFS